MPARRLRRPLLGLAAVLALSPAAAHAQACVTGTLESYLNLAGTCTLGGVAFGPIGFLSGPFTDVTGSGAAEVADAANVLVIPFTELDPLGRPRFGFRFDGLFAAASVPGGGAGAGTGSADFALLWTGQSVTPGLRVRRAGVAFSLAGSTATPGRTKLFMAGGAFAVGGTFASGLGSICLDDVTGFRDRTGPTDEQFFLERRCDDVGGAGPAPMEAFATIVAATASVERGDSDRTQEGSALVDIQAITWTSTQVVPEPATVALLGGGLALLGGVAARRRRG